MADALTELKLKLEEAFSAATELYRARGFQRRVGFGRKPALVNACVRATICDGLAEGFRPIAVKECIGDRVPGALEWNLFDIDAKFGDVVGLDACVDYLDTVSRRND